MKISFFESKRAVLLAVSVIGMAFFSPSALAAISVGSGSGQGPKQTPYETWVLADGSTINAAISDYSLQSRVISFRHSNGRISHVTPRDLTAVSKLRWLTSPAFMEAVEGYRLPKGAIGHLFSMLGAPLLTLLLALFLAFWAGSAMVSGERKIGPAAGAYLASLLWAVGIVVVMALLMRAVSLSFGTSPMAPFVHTILIGGAIIAILGLASFQVGSRYALSGGAGIGAVLLSCGIAFLTAVVTLYLLPRFLKRPGIDDWFTDHLLTPLGLA